MASGPQKYHITAYFYLNVNTGNVIAEPAILANAVSKEYDGVMMWQTRNQGTIKLEEDWDVIKDVSMLKITVPGDLDVYLICGTPTIEGSRTAAIPVVVEPLLSSGGLSKINVIQGWVERAHVDDDSIFENILPEPWAPSNHLRIISDTEIHTKDETVTNIEIIGSTIDLDGMSEYAATLLTATESGDTMLIPTLPALASDKYTTLEFDGEEYVMPGIGLYYMRAYSEQTALAREIGVESAITDAYVMPAPDLMITGSGKYSKVAGKVLTYSPEMPYAYGNVKNNKALVLYNMYTLVSTSSADRIDFEASELFSGGTAPDWFVKIDPSPAGNCYCMPTYYEGKQTKRLEHAVAGAGWPRAGLVMTGAAGSALSMAQASRQNRRGSILDTAIDEGKVTAANAKTTGDIITGKTESPYSGRFSGLQELGRHVGAGINFLAQSAASAFNIKGTKQESNLEMGDRLFETSVATSVQAPRIQFPVSVAAVSYYGNSFLIYHIGLSVNDLKRFDDFLTAYGYKSDKAFAKSDLDNRTHFNYIKTSGAQVTAPAVSQEMLDALGRMFDNGVRIWHELPNAAAFADNPIKAGD